MMHWIDQKVTIKTSITQQNFPYQIKAVLLNFLFIKESWKNYHSLYQNTKLHNCIDNKTCSSKSVWNIAVIFHISEREIKLRWALFVTYTIIQSITSCEMCSLHLTHPSARTPGAVGSRHCGTRGAFGGSVPCSRISPQSWIIPAGAEIRTHNLGLQDQCSIH